MHRVGRKPGISVDPMAEIACEHPRTGGRAPAVEGAEVP